MIQWLGSSNDTTVGKFQRYNGWVAQTISWYDGWAVPTIQWLGSSNDTMVGQSQRYNVWAAPTTQWLGSSNDTTVG